MQRAVSAFGVLGSQRGNDSDSRSRHPQFQPPFVVQLPDWRLLACQSVMQSSWLWSLRKSRRQREKLSGILCLRRVDLPGFVEGDDHLESLAAACGESFRSAQALCTTILHVFCFANSLRAAAAAPEALEVWLCVPWLRILPARLCIFFTYIYTRSLGRPWLPNTRL